ncbi:MAG: potassium channel family protein [Bacteroidota bacterium]
MRQLLKRNQEFWTHERSISALLIYLSLSLFLWLPLSGDGWFEFLIRDVLFTLVVLSGIFAVLTKWKQQLLFILMGVIAMAVRVSWQLFNLEWLGIASVLTMLTFLSLLGWLVLRHIFKEGPVNFYRVQGSIVVYLIVGIVWAYLYDLIHQVDPLAFESAKSIHATEESLSQFVYFSFVTQTTLGYGDMVPVNPIAKSLVIFQGMFGMLYPVIMIARLVAMELEHSRATRKY